MLDALHLLHDLVSFGEAVAHLLRDIGGCEIHRRTPSQRPTVIASMGSVATRLVNIGNLRLHHRRVFSDRF